MLERRSPDTTLERLLYKQERPAMHEEDVPWVEPYITGEVTGEPTQEVTAVPDADDGGEAGSGQVGTP